MFVPAARQHVRVRNFAEEFLVLSVDQDANFAVVVSTLDGMDAEEVPFTDLSPCETELEATA